MNFKLILINLVILCLVLLIGADQTGSMPEADIWEGLDDLENEADYDDFIKSYNLRSAPRRPVHYDYLGRVKRDPRFRPGSSRQYREIYPTRDFEGNCPPGYRSDRAGNCREMW